eukprot:9708170-Heterocapsa_arctica.AAC.1
MAAAAVAMPVPPGGLPAEPTHRKKVKMFEAVRNGPVQQSAAAEFRRCVKDCLQWRESWTYKLTNKERSERAANGSSRFYPGKRQALPQVALRRPRHLRPWQRRLHPAARGCGRLERDRPHRPDEA